jgi:arylsulfatase B
MKNPRIGAAFASRAICAALALLVFPAAAAEKPNVLVIVADDLGFADVGFDGGTIPTPNLDRLAATGVNLTGFHAAPICSPTRAGLMTGRWPLRFGMMRAVVPPWSKYGLPAEEKTIPELLAPAGYDQRGLTGKWHLGHARREFLPLAHGFTSFYGHYNGAIDYFTHERDGQTDWHRNDQTIKEPGYSTDLVGAEAARFVREAPDEKPWLLYMPLNAPHSPMQAKEEDLAKFSTLGPKKRVYAAMVNAMDQAIGEVLTAVEARPDAADTLVLFFSDNGGVKGVGSSNGPYRGAKLGVYEGGTRACAAIRWPAAGLTGGKRFDGRVGYIDVLPTLLAAAGTEAPKNLDGIDFLPALRDGKPLPERPWFSYIHQDEQAHASVHLGSWKLVAHGDFFSESPEARATWELYDLSADPGEAKDVAGQHPEKVAELRKLLREFGSWQKPGVGPYTEGREGFKAPKDWIITG